ncbi:hypothetical protein ACFQ1I_18350 [Kitasatospora arboriphila]
MPPSALPPAGSYSVRSVLANRPWIGGGHTSVLRSTCAVVAPPGAPAVDGSAAGRSSAIPKTTPSTATAASSDRPVRLPPGRPSKLGFLISGRLGFLRPAALMLGFFIAGQFPVPWWCG